MIGYQNCSFKQFTYSFKKFVFSNMLTGYHSPSSGAAFIAGYNVESDFSEVRKTLGVCPQRDVLFEL